MVWPLKVELNAGTGEHRLFHLSRDPNERVDMAKEHPELVDELTAWFDAVEFDPGGGQEGAPISERTRERLRELGYVK